MPVTQAASSPARRTFRRALTGALFLALALYAGLCLFMFLMQRNLQYRPDAARVPPAAIGLPAAEEITLTTTDGETLVAWWLAPRDDTSPVYLYLHGNAGNLARRSARLQRLAQNGAGVLALSWRGYGGSTGSPTEAGFHADARTAHGWLMKRTAPERLILLGESIGSGVAVTLASTVPLRALALDSPYSSTADIARQRYPWLPVGWLMLDQFRADRDAPRVTAPVFIGHCSGDPTIPIAFARRLAALFPVPPHMEIFPGACHPAPYQPFLDALDQFIARLGPP